MFTTQADCLEIYSACFEVTKNYGKWQDLSKFPPEDGSNYMCSRCCLLANEVLLKIPHSVTPTVPGLVIHTGGHHWFILIFFIYYQDDTVGRVLIL